MRGVTFLGKICLFLASGSAIEFAMPISLCQMVGCSVAGDVEENTDNLEPGYNTNRP